MTVRSANFDTNQIAIDSGALSKLKQSAGQDPKSALRATAQQFETLFMNMLMKSMRDTLPKDGLLSSSANDMYTGMLDQQLAQKMSSRGTGIADMIVKQLSMRMKSPDGADGAEIAENPATTMNIAGARVAGMRDGRPIAEDVAPNIINGNNAMIGVNNPAKPAIRYDDKLSLMTRLQGTRADNPVRENAVPAPVAVSDAPRSFVNQMNAHAQDAERITGVPAKFMLGQAALESGWGKKEITHADGRPAHNLFGIKAGNSWTGNTVSVTTTEYVGGVARKMIEKFRAYSSYAESFRDYANLVAGNPRYQDVIKRGGNVEGFANAMQRAGYATDPHYAEKLSKTINQMISLNRVDQPGVTSGKQI